MNVWVVCRREANDEWPFAVYAKKSAANRRKRELDVEAAEEATGYEHHVEMVAFHE